MHNKSWLNRMTHNEYRSMMVYQHFMILSMKKTWIRKYWLQLTVNWRGQIPCLISEWVKNWLLPVEEISQTSQQSLLSSLVLSFVLQHFISEWFTEIQSLEYWVGVASIAKVDQAKIVFIGRKEIWANILL